MKPRKINTKKKQAIDRLRQQEHTFITKKKENLI